jgi:hypothetical protein
MVVRGLRVEGCGCGSSFPTWGVGIIYFLNNQLLTCPVSSVGWCVVLQWPKGPEFDSHSEHILLYI